MAKVLSSISGNLISAASAGYAPTNSADVSAIASGYQVVSSTATQLYAGTAFLTEVNGASVSASMAGQAANASMANSAYYDGTGRFISALPDSAAVSSIASSYAESAASGKADSSSLYSYALSADVSGVIDTVSANSASWGAGATLPIIGSAGTDSATYGETSVEFNRYDTAGEPDIRTATLSPDALDITYTVDENDYYSVHINENGVEFSDPDGYYTVTPYDITNWNSAVETVANNSATWGQGSVDSATVSSIASSYAESAVSSKLDTSAQVVSATAGDGTYITSINGMGLSGQGGGGGGGVVTATAGSASYVTSINNSAIAVKHIMQNATQLAGSIGFYYMPTASPFGQPTGVLSPLQYATGACLAMVNGSFNAYYKGNELFVTNTSYGVVRMEVHQSRGEHVYGSSMNSATGFHIHGSGTDGQLGTAKKWRIGASGISGQSSTSTPWQYGYAEYDQLTSVHDTVSANSASWGGGGGASLPITGSAGDDTATYGVTGIEFTRNDTAGEPDIRTATLSPDQFYIDYTLDGIDHTSMMLTESMLDFGDSDGDHIVDAYSIDSWNSAVDTVSNNSASWGQGGVDSATVSAIASSYAESAVSSKLDTSAQVVTSTASAYDMDGYAWTTEINGLEISAAKAYSASYANTAETAYSADFASSSDKATYDTDGRFLSSLTDSATVSAIASSYAESAVSSKLDTTAQVVSATAGDGTYVTSINGMGISGQGGGGAQVVTATGSASATAGTPLFPITTYFVSSINGSALLPYGYSVLSGNSANWTSTNSAVSANSAKWTSTNSAVSANSAKWTSTNSAVSANSANWNSAYSLISGVTALMDAI